MSFYICWTAGISDHPRYRKALPYGCERNVILVDGVDVSKEPYSEMQTGANGYVVYLRKLGPYLAPDTHKGYVEFFDMHYFWDRLRLKIKRWWKKKGGAL
jgi:hypothetical protein